MKNKTIGLLIWTLPLVVLFYFLATVVAVPDTAHPALMFRVFLLSCGFTGMISYIYRRVEIIGVAIIVGILAIFAFGFTSQYMHYLYWTSALALGVIELINLGKTFTIKDYLHLAIAALILILILMPYFSLGYSQPYNEALISKISLDTLYHVAIASMIKGYHVISHGLHGLGQLEYHFGSHFLMVSASQLIGLSTFQAYNYFFPFFTIPLLALITVSVAEEFLPSENYLDFFKKLLMYAFFILGTGIMGRDTILDRYGMSYSFYVSESFTLSLVFFFAFMSLMKSKLYETHERAFIFFVIVGVGLVAISKISTGLCSLAFLGSWALLSKEVRWSKEWKNKWGIFTLGFLLFVVIYKVISSGKGDGDIKPFDFIKYYVDIETPLWIRSIFFLPLHFLVPFLGLFIFKHKEFKANFPNWWSLGTKLILLGGFLIIVLARIQGGSAAYFSQVSWFAILPYMLCLPIILKPAKKRAKQVMLLIAVIGCLVYGPIVLVRGAGNFLSGMKQKAEPSALGAYVEKLRSIRDNPETKRSVVYIPRTEEYWKSMWCRGTGFFIPAISERPALYAWPSYDCYYFLCGNRFHPNGLCEKSQESFTDEQLLTEAHKLGFDAVDIVTSKEIRILK